MKVKKRVFARHVAQSSLSLKAQRELSNVEVRQVAGAEGNTNVFTHAYPGSPGGKWDQQDC